MKPSAPAVTVIRVGNSETIRQPVPGKLREQPILGRNVVIQASGSFPSVVQISRSSSFLILRTADSDGAELERNSGAGKGTGLEPRDCAAAGA